MAAAVDVQRNGGDVVHIHIGNAEIHQHVCETVTFALPWKRKREKEHDTIKDLDMSQRKIYNGRCSTYMKKEMETYK